MIVIAVSGWKGSGKDTLADYLSKEYGYKRMAFADALKDMTSDQYDINKEMFYDQNMKEEPLVQYPVEGRDAFSDVIHSFMLKEFRSIDGITPQDIKTVNKETKGLIHKKSTTAWETIYWTPRSLLILEGSVKRSVSSNHWVQQVISQIKKQNTFEGRNNFVITDLRYKTEVEQLYSAFGSDLITCRINRFQSTDSADPSERDLDGYPLDFHIDNTGSLRDLEDNADDIVEFINGEKF